MAVYKGENKEHCDEVIKEILENWDELINNKHEKNKEGNGVLGTGMRLIDANNLLDFLNALEDAGGRISII